MVEGRSSRFVAHLLAFAAGAGLTAVLVVTGVLTGGEGGIVSVNAPPAGTAGGPPAVEPAPPQSQPVPVPIPVGTPPAPSPGSVDAPPYPGKNGGGGSWGGKNPRPLPKGKKALTEALFVAVRKGSAKEVEALLRAGADLEGRNTKGDTPLLFALRERWFKNLESLLRAGADLHAKNRGQTALHVAAMKYSAPAIVERLLHAGAAVNPLDDLGWTPLCITLMQRSAESARILRSRGGSVPSGREGDLGLLVAAKVGDLEGLKRFLERGARLEARDCFGRTPLAVAVMENHAVLVSYLLARGAAVHWPSREKSRLLLDAESDAVFEALLRAGADVNGGGGYSPLHGAAESGNPDRVRLLLESGAGLEARDSAGRTPLMVSLEHPEILRVLLAKGADPNARDERGNTVLHHASAAGQNALFNDDDPDMRRGMVRDLLGKGANPNLTGRGGMTPLHRACEGGDAEMVRLLLGHGADVNVLDEEGVSSLQYAAMDGNLETARLLLDAGAGVNTRSSCGDTPLHDAVSSLNADLVRLLLSAGASVNTADEDGETPLHGLIGNEWKEAKATAVLLIEAGADVNAPSADRQTVLHYFSGRRRTGAALRTLVAAGADVNAPDGHGNTSLHRAAGDGEEGNVRVLLELGADPSRKNQGEKTPSDVAAEKGYAFIVQLLREHEKK